MTKMIQKSVILTVVLGLLLAAAAPSAMAQDRCHRRGYTSSRDYNDDYRRDRYDNDDYRRDRYRNDYYNPQATTGKAVGRTAAGAGIGALAGALIGGGKGAAIGALIGGAGGYIYHQQKVNNQNDRWRR
jgi:YmgG-like glycine-zipper protein